jgi:phosphoglycolate phosphatase-like HAD superfamily hydrolase
MRRLCLFFVWLLLNKHSAAVKMLGDSRVRVSAVLWDVDGTLSDSFALGFGATKTVLERNGIGAISDDDYHAGTKYTTPRRLAWHVTGNPDDPIGLELGKQFEDLYVDLVSPSTAPLYEGILPMLSTLKQEDPSLKFGALSNACGAYVKAVVKCNDLTSLFPVVQLGADEVPAAKPSGAGLLHCAQLLNVDPSKCIYVGVSPSDAAAASNAGFLASVGVTWGSHKEEKVREAFTYTAYSVEELTHILLALMEGQDLV